MSSAPHVKGIGDHTPERTIVSSQSTGKEEEQPDADKYDDQPGEERKNNDQSHPWLAGEPLFQPRLLFVMLICALSTFVDAQSRFEHFPKLASRPRILGYTGPERLAMATKVSLEGRDLAK